jgi:opacity protein-like surface antigen
MQRICFSAVFLSLMTGAVAAHAGDGDQGLYLRLDSGESFSRAAGGDVGNDVGNANIIGGGVGYRFNEYIRSDATLSYRHGYKINSTIVMDGQTYYSRGHTSSLTGLVNLYAEPVKFGIVRPYAGGGLGFSRNRTGDVSITVDNLNGSLQGATHTSFAWQLSAGIGFDLTSNLSADIGYRYMDMGEARTGSHVNIAGTTSDNWTSRGNLTAHELQMGLRYQF